MYNFPGEHPPYEKKTIIIFSFVWMEKSFGEKFERPFFQKGFFKVLKVNHSLTRQCWIVLSLSSFSLNLFKSPGNGRSP